ncbi:NAD-dependent epimerase/dehydratase family protein [Gammaproteobacteria bacterium]|nr:NAD-dependent epimerase/dehydratase family protein [Gammaproteobacteria bacterium]
MRAVVTGGAGFIGSHLCDFLISEGAEVSVIDNLSTGNEDNLNSNVDFINDDINSRSLDTYLKNKDYVFHVAALPRITPSFDDRFVHHIANTDGTLNVIEASHRQGIKKIVFSGSSAVYGQPLVTPTDETSPIAPLNPYALQKYTAEQYGLLIGKHLSLPFISLRYFNPYGPRSYNPDNEYSAYSSVIGIFQNRVSRGLAPMITGDGTQLRDFIHVKDLAKANVCAALSKENFGTFNIGFGQAKSVLEIASLLSTEIEFIESREGEASITLADISKAKLLLNWSPSIDVMDYLRDWLSAQNIKK